MSNKITHMIGKYLKRHPSSLPLYIATLLLVLHTFVIAYVNSSYLEQFFTTTGVGVIYTLGSALSVVSFLFIAHFLKKFGNLKMSLGLLLLNFFSVVGMAYAQSLHTALPFFLIHLISVPLIIFNIDVFIEDQIGNNENSTGSKRGLLLTLISLVGAIAPLVSSLTVDLSSGSFTNVYLLSAFTLIPIIALLFFYFNNFTDPEYEQTSVFSAVRKFWKILDIRHVLFSHLSLQLFFMLMIVFTPIYLIEHIGLTWTQFGIVMFFAQMAYVIFEYPIGIIADRYIGEKEMMGFGFLIIIISTSWMSFVSLPNIWLWTIIMFIARVGASFVEVTTESYFFKKTKSSDAQVISFFRVTRPLAYVFGSIFGSLTLLYLPFNLIFIAFAIAMIPAMFLTTSINDTK